MTKVTYKRLRTNWGWAYIGEGRIEICKTAKNKKHLEIMVHELLHLELPDHEEKAIVRISKMVAQALWDDGYRKLPK